MNNTRADLMRLRRMNDLLIKHFNNDQIRARCLAVSRRIGDRIRNRQRQIGAQPPCPSTKPSTNKP